MKERIKEKAREAIHRLYHIYSTFTFLWDMDKRGLYLLAMIGVIGALIKLIITLIKAL